MTDPYHTIIDRPWEYEVRDFHYHVEDNCRDSHIDLVLTREGVNRRLRFEGPVDLTIESGFPHRTGGMVILDIRGRQLDGLGVSVIDVEGSSGTMTFMARRVLDLDGLHAD